MMKESRSFLAKILLGTFLLLAGLSGSATAQEQVVRATLDNGLRVIVVVDSLVPLVHVQVDYLVGSNQTPEGFPGTAHALEHMMFRGSPGLSGDQLSTIMAALGGDSNADTQQTVTQYFVTTPVGQLEPALRVEALRMKGILSTEDLWAKERGAIDQEVARDLSEPMYLFHTRMQKQMFAGTPYAVDALGDKPSFDKTTGAMLKKFHKEWYGPNNAILFIVGDVDPAPTLKLVQKIFGVISSRPTPKRSPVKLGPLVPTRIDMGTDLSYGLAVAAYRLPGYDSPDYAAGVILGDVLDSRRARLYDLVTEGAALSAGFSAEDRGPASLGFVVATYAKGGDGETLLKRLQGIVDGYRSDGVPAGLVKAAKDKEIAAAQFAKNSPEGLAFAWAQAVAVEGRNSPDDDIEAIRRVKVDDVNRVARTWLDRKRAVTAVLTPMPSGKPVSGAASRSKEAFAPKEVKPVPLPAWARELGNLKVPVSPPPPQEFRLENGLRLIVLPSGVSPTVSLYGQVRSRAEIQEPEGKEGVAAVLAELFSYGTTSLDRRAYQKALDEIAASAAAGTDFSLQILDDRFERGLALLADNLLHPALPEKAFEVVRREEAGALVGERQSPDYHARRALLKALFPPTDPVLREPTPETVAGLRLDDVKTYYREVFRPDLTTIVIIGRVEPETARRLIGKYFGDWRAQGKVEDLDLPAVPPSRASVSLVPDPSRVQDEVTLAQAGDVTRTDRDYYPLQVGMNVLSGGFYATRLFRDLREETGLVYSVGARLDAGPNRSVLTVAYGCDPENVGRARTLIESDLQDMQRQEVAPDELRQAKLLMLRGIPLSRASVDAIAGQYLALVHDRLPLDEPQRAAHRIVGITAKEVRAAFTRRIHPAQMVQITQGPAPK